jgi:hypothetical protein
MHPEKSASFSDGALSSHSFLHGYEMLVFQQDGEWFIGLPGNLYQRES